MRKTLVWHQGALGDLLLSLPSIHAIRMHMAGYLHLVCRPGIDDIVLRNGIADEVSSNEQAIFAGLFSSASPRGELSSFLRTFSAAFIFMKNRDPDFSAAVMKDIATCRFVSTSPPSVPGLTLRDWQLGQMEAAGVPVTSNMPFLDVPALPPIEQAGGRIIALHPGSGGKRKCWPLDNFLDLMRVFGQKGGYFFRVILGPAESSEVRDRTAAYIREHRLQAEVIADRPLLEVASHIKISSAYVGNDSGITHLAAMLGTPTAALFGPTDHAVWGPSGGHVRIVRADLPCSPCADEAMRACGRRECLNRIGVREVMVHLDEMVCEPRVAI